MLLNEGLVGELKEVLQGVSLIPSIKLMVREELAKHVNAEKIDGIFVGHIETLDETETFYLLKSIYHFTSDEKFNPANLYGGQDSEEDDDDYEIVNGEKKKKPKDRMHRLYYDFDYKNKFASEYPDQTRRVIMALFRKTAKYERLYEKDIFDFDLNELRDVIKSFKTKTIRSLQNQISTIERYIDFAQKDKDKKTVYKVNFASALDSAEKLESLLDKEAEENMIFDRDEIMEMALNTDNAQDGVILGLLFDGVSHKNEFEELVNLTKQDFNFEDKLINLEDRTIPMSHETKMLVEDALDQDRKYVSISGETTRNYTIAEGDHVLRGLRGKNKVKGQIVSQRILRIAELFDYPYLNATTISYSGQLCYAKELINEQKMNMDEVIDEVLRRFSIPNNTSSQFYLKTRIEKYLDI